MNIIKTKTELLNAGFNPVPKALEEIIRPEVACFYKQEGRRILIMEQRDDGVCHSIYDGLFDFVRQYFEEPEREVEL